MCPIWYLVLRSLHGYEMPTNNSLNSLASKLHALMAWLPLTTGMLQVYTIYSILSIVFLILIVVTAFITVALTYFQLAVEDHRWWWRSFLNGGSTGVRRPVVLCFWASDMRSKHMGAKQYLFRCCFLCDACKLRQYARNTVTKKAGLNTGSEQSVLCRLVHIWLLLLLLYLQE